jgi:hypothetical protein
MSAAVLHSAVLFDLLVRKLSYRHLDQVFCLGDRLRSYLEGNVDVAAARDVMVRKKAEQKKKGRGKRALPLEWEHVAQHRDLRQQYRVVAADAVPHHVQQAHGNLLQFRAVDACGALGALDEHEEL